MESKMESLLRLRSRLRTIDESIDEMIDNNNRVTVINISESDLIATNHTIYRICQQIISKYEPIIETNDSQINENNDKSVDNLTQNNSQFIIYSLSNETNNDFYNDINEQNIDLINPLIIIYDGLGAFNLMRFSSILSSINRLKYININRVNDENQLLIALNNDLSIHLALNNKLKLIVIYANSSNIFPQIVDKINEILFSLVISVRIILVVDRINKFHKKCYLERNSFQIIKCKSIDGFKQIEITNEKTKQTFRRDIQQKI
jgi:hypothetical protein